MLADRGATLIDADVLAREAVRPETQALRDIVKRWGKDILKHMFGHTEAEALGQSLDIIVPQRQPLRKLGLGNRTSYYAHFDSTSRFKLEGTSYVV